MIPYFNAADFNLFGVVTLKIPGLLLLSGIILGSIAALAKARRDHMEVQQLSGFLPWLFIALFVGGHMDGLFSYLLSWLRNQPTAVRDIFIGESSVGAILAATIAGIVYFTRKRRSDQLQASDRLSLWRNADALVYGGTLGWSMGRLGCFAVHDHPGVETNFWLGVYGICPNGQRNVACHDLGLYEAVLSLGLFVVLKVLDKRPQRPGCFVAVVALVYGIGRFSLDFLRHPLVDPRYLGLTVAQWAAFTLIGVGARIVFQRCDVGQTHSL